MTEYEKVTASNIGCMIREIRKIRGYTLRQLADKVSIIVGESISAASIGSWERGEKQISASQLCAVSKALKVTPQTIIDNRNIKPDDFQRIAQEINSLTDAEKQTLITLLSWNGDMYALMQANLMYMAMDRSSRQDVSGFEVMCYKQALSSDRVDTTIKVDVESVEKAWANLMKTL